MSVSEYLDSELLTDLVRYRSGTPQNAVAFVGTLRKHPRSISFASMDETEFSQLYNAALDVLWRWILSRAFGTRMEAENVAMQLMSFAGQA